MGRSAPGAKSFDVDAPRVRLRGPLELFRLWGKLVLTTHGLPAAGWSSASAWSSSAAYSGAAADRARWSRRPSSSG